MIHLESELTYTGRSPESVEPLPFQSPYPSPLALFHECPLSTYTTYPNDSSFDLFDTSELSVGGLFKSFCAPTTMTQELDAILGSIVFSLPPSFRPIRRFTVLWCDLFVSPHPIHIFYLVSFVFYMHTRSVTFRIQSQPPYPFTLKSPHALFHTCRNANQWDNTACLTNILSL